MRILTFDVEEWFHILDHRSTQTEKEWNKFDNRIHENMDRIFKLLDRSGMRATFFCVGWIAKKYPEVIRSIVDKGYDIGSHTQMHQLAYTQNKTEFHKDVECSIKTLEDLTGCPIKYFRAPGFSITEKNKWAFEILADLNIETDCSVFPVNRAHGGFPSFKESCPSIIRYNGIEMKEMPMNYLIIWGKSLIFSGGGYFRLLPYSFIKKLTKNSDYVMTYFHPRDFDAAQPVIQDLSLIRKFKSYVGLQEAEKKLIQWLNDFDFVDVGTADQMINWEKVPVVEI